MNPDTAPTPSITFLVGRASPARAEIWAVVEGQTPPEARWSGHWEGPLVRHGRTLTTRGRFVAAPNGAGRAEVVDPIFWTPDVPALYHVSAELRVGESVVGSARWEVGIRPLATRGRDLRLEGKRWVARGVDHRLSVEAPAAFRAASAAMLVDDPTDDLCLEASREGVVLLARLQASDSALGAERARRLAAFPAVAIIAPSFAWPESEPRPGALLAEWLEPGASFTGRTWGDVLVADRRDAARLAAAVEMPVVAVAETAGYDDLRSARAACDQLQRDLAPQGDFAGYLVVAPR